MTRQERHVREDLDSDRGVRLHHPPLRGIQRAALVEDVVRDRDLADVVQEEPVLEPVIGEQPRIHGLGQRQRVLLNAFKPTTGSVS